MITRALIYISIRMLINQKSVSFVCEPGHGFFSGLYHLRSYVFHTSANHVGTDSLIYTRGRHRSRSVYRGSNSGAGVNSLPRMNFICTCSGECSRLPRRFPVAFGAGESATMRRGIVSDRTVHRESMELRKPQTARSVESVTILNLVFCLN